MKPNKSYTKRIKETPTGKLMVRAIGQNHYNAKQSGEERLGKRRVREIEMTSKERGRFLGKNRTK